MQRKPDEEWRPGLCYRGPWPPRPVAMPYNTPINQWREEDVRPEYEEDALKMMAKAAERRRFEHRQERRKLDRLFPSS